MNVATHVTIGNLRPVHRIGLGGNKFCGPGIWGPPRDVEATVTAVRVACDSGVELIDTAGSYGPGWSEEIIGRALGGRADPPLVATKVGKHRGPDQSWIVDATPNRLIEEIHASLARLQRERLDLVQLHGVDRQVPLDESLGVLWDLRAKGDIGEVGVCNVSAEQLTQALGTGPVASVQNRLSPQQVDPSTLAVLDTAATAGIAFLGHQPFDHGRVFLSDVLGHVPHRMGRSAPGQLLLRLLLELGPHVVPLPGSGDVAHIRANLGALQLALTEPELIALLHELPASAVFRERITSGRGATGSLPPRLGTAPRTTLEVPQQQISQNGDPRARDELIRRAEQLSGVRVQRTLLAIPGSVAFHMTDEPVEGALMAGTEFLHFHPPHDGSLHAVFSPEDHAELLTKGWAIPHLLVRYIVHERSLMIWAPRDAAELEVCWHIVQRAHRYAMSVTSRQEAGAR
ncbi:aldo/keto reductase [Streptomyces sp. G-G2]|uniref:aldo/keto reductase n=1 Tax=Streptomyces sp. G-G2 TaxID=3046201 RepID=UPI0024B8A7C3|nr:aldo/keto reductase [Streptomyces sp. G-G2]MDJ0386087.1 aldo/keto reductase [Streptomyces sp. G-G2]